MEASSGASGVDERVSVAFTIQLQANAGVAGLLKLVSVVHARQLQVAAFSWTAQPDVPVAAWLEVRLAPAQIDSAKNWLARCVEVTSVAVVSSP